LTSLHAQVTEDNERLCHASHPVQFISDETKK